MEFPTQIVPEYDYRPYYGPLFQEEESWERSPVFRGQQINRMSANGSPVQLSMDRYLQERERPSTWFTTRGNEPEPPFPGLDHDQKPYHHYGDSHYSYRYPSPTESGQSSSTYSSSGHNDHYSTPLSSPNPSAAPLSPEALFLDHHGSGYGFRYRHDELEPGVSGPCVTMHEIQGYPDAQLEAITHFEDDQHFYASLPQEGFEPMEQEVEPEHDHPVTNGVNGITNGTGHNHRVASSPESPNIRRRRPTSSRSATSPTKVTKRPASSRRTSSFSKTNNTKNSSYCQASNRAFPCPFAIYNCVSTFGAKNEWKRHVNTQHMQTGFWRCDQCDHGEKKPNDFNRKDLFIQHIRRMHLLETSKPPKTKSPSSRSPKNDPEEREMSSIAARCFVSIRTPPEDCACIVCEATFTGANAWDERLEHIGKHWESGKKENEEPNDPKQWREDRALHDFLDDQGIIAAEGKRWILAH